MLLSTMNEDTKDKVKIVKDVLDRVTFYINPEIYKVEKEYEKTGRIPGQIVNMDYAQQVASGRATGKPQPSKWVRDILNKLYYTKEKHNDT